MPTFSTIAKIIAIRDKVYINTEIAPQFWSINPKSLSIPYQPPFTAHTVHTTNTPKKIIAISILTSLFVISIDNANEYTIITVATIAYK